MTATQSLHATPPAKMTVIVHANATSAPHAATMDAWLHDEVALAYDELKANPSSAIPIAQLRADIAARRHQARDANA